MSDETDCFTLSDRGRRLGYSSLGECSRVFKWGDHISLRMLEHLSVGWRFMEYLSYSTSHCSHLITMLCSFSTSASQLLELYTIRGAFVDLGVVQRLLQSRSSICVNLQARACHWFLNGTGFILFNLLLSRLVLVTCMADLQVCATQ
jgi:hypothetical protein